MLTLGSKSQIIEIAKIFKRLIIYLPARVVKGGGAMGVLLLLPFFLIRFGLMALLNRAAISRAAHFAPMQGKEMAAYWLYQLSNLAILVYLLFLHIKPAPPLLFYAGWAVYVAGNVLLVFSVVHFAFPSANGVNQKGLYRISRNPMYLAYFVYFLGCVLLTQSFILLALVFLFQLAAHWVILAEERWCAENLGEEYRRYAREVRRYL